MEPFLTARCLQNIKDKSLSVDRLTMDGDTSTFARVKKSLYPQLKKSNDKNHIIKNLGTELYKIKTVHKQLTTDAIKHVQKCFSYAVSQNKFNKTGIRDNITAIVPHMYTDHTSSQWVNQTVSLADVGG